MKVVIYYGPGEGTNADKLHAELADKANWFDPQMFSVGTEYSEEEA